MASLLVTEIAARLKGDDTTAQAAKVARKCTTYVKSQIAALEAKEVDQEDAVETAEEALKEAKFPTEAPSSGQAYVNRITKAEEALEEAKDSLEATQESIKYFTKLKKDFSAEVKA